MKNQECMNRHFLHSLSLGWMQGKNYYACCTPVRLPVARLYTECMCADAYVFTCTPVAWIWCKLQRISCRRQLKCQACASAFILSVIGLSTSSSSVVGLRLPFSLFVIVPVLSLSCPGWLLEGVPTAVEDGLLRL